MGRSTHFPRPLWLLAAALALIWPQQARCQFLAVFVDGRIREVTGVAVVAEDRVRLDLPEGGWMEIPLVRLQGVLEDVPEAVLPPPPTFSCHPGWEDEGLPPVTPFRGDIMAAARRFDLHPWLVAAVIDAESRFNPGAVSRAGARGLMQLMPVVWRDAGVGDPHDVVENLNAGTQHLRRLLDRFGDLPLALAAYNAGPAVVDRYQGVPPFGETRRYVARVLGRFCPAAEHSAEEP